MEDGRRLLCLSFDVVVALFVTEGTAGLSFCAHCDLSIDEVDELSHSKAMKMDTIESC